MPPKKPDRCAVGLGLGPLAAAYIAVPNALDLIKGPLSFTSLENPDGFRKMEGGGTSTGFDLFVGLDAETDPDLKNVVTAVRADLRPALFPAGTEGVPIASFSDYYCPYYRILTERLGNLVKAGSADVAVNVSWHELPLLGATSVMAAKTALSAKKQGAYLAFHTRMMRSRFQSTPEYPGLIADSIGIDRQLYLDDMKGPDVADEIRRSRALGRIFGFFGTLALVVGRTVVQGNITEEALQRLIERERADGPVAACG
ncbi:MAG: protein-disulfide isomerase [Paracoccaceae bacterium]|jgi:protein-disulfide isomerase